MIVGKDSCYKVLWIGSENGNGGFGILLAEGWMEKVYEFCRISDYLMMIKLAIENNIITVLSRYAHQVGLDNRIKDAFYNLLNNLVNKLNATETLVICDDFNGQVGKLANGYECVHSGQKIWKKDGSKEDYNLALKVAKQTVFAAIENLKNV